MTVVFAFVQAVAMSACVGYLFCHVAKQHFFPENDPRASKRSTDTFAHMLLAIMYVHVMDRLGVLRFDDSADWTSALTYCFIVDAVYACVHYVQHCTHTHEHSQSEPYPGHAFSVCPKDCVAIQFAAQSPFYFGWSVSSVAWRASISWLAFCMIVGCADHGWFDVRRRHHARPYEGHFSLTGVPEFCMRQLR